MDIIHNILFLPTHFQQSYPTTANLLIPLTTSLLPIFTLTAVVLLICHVYFTGLWFYYNERIFVTRGCGEDDAAKCIDVLNETGLGPNTGALEWYWRMQCEGNRDAWEGGGGLGLLNQQWIWTIFDTFWESVFGPCLHAMAYFTASVSRLYDSEFVTWIAAVLNACLRIASITVDWAFWVISSWASYFDWVPTIKHAFATIGDWLQASARTLVNKNYLPEKISGIDSGVAESYFSFIWKHSAAFITLVVAILGNSWNKCTDYLDEMSLNESFSHILAVIETISHWFWCPIPACHGVSSPSFPQFGP
ncbi:hypothetical protein IFR04_014251 [Cadophora malorum]|uniref:Uncharacterized protein n=1 Tax=Cadophora malorum TaxID=108018 RepID=A0A8H7T429_9HELO|nr:hypothetical protein IFR04_014251 [Cadophora malorum]